MAGQRRREPECRRRGGGGGLGGLALAVCLTLLPACGDGGPTGSQRPQDDDGTSSGGGAAELLVGTWRTVIVVEVPGDIQTWTTTWRFDADGDCLQTVETESLAEGFPRVTERPCTFLVGDFEITVAFTGGATLEFEYSFADFSPDRLILDGFEYDRLA
jgi:hypothetical protein